MKKSLFIAAALIAGMFMAHNTYAASTLSQGAAGETATFAVTIPGAKDLTYTPSSNVVMAGTSDETGFLINSYHTQALGKAAGQAYAMTADSNTIWFFAIEDETDTTNIQVSGTNSGVLSSYTKM